MNNFNYFVHPIIEVIFMIDNNELPLGFTMTLAQHSDILNQFAQLPKNEQDEIVERAKQVRSKKEMRDYVTSIFKE